MAPNLLNSFAMSNEEALQALLKERTAMVARHEQELQTLDEKIAHLSPMVRHERNLKITMRGYHKES